MRKINKIYIHHSAMDKELGFDAIKKYHISLGYEDIGYHFVIEKDGKIVEGRSVEKIGAHTKGDNINSIGICVCGNFEIEEPTKEQIDALKYLLKMLVKKYGKVKILGHKDFANYTLCPGKNLYKYIPHLIENCELKSD